MCGSVHTLHFSIYLLIIVLVLVFIHIASLLGEVNTDRTSMQWISATSLSYSSGNSKCIKCLKYLPLKQKYTVFRKCRYGSNLIKNGNMLNYVLKWKLRNILIAVRIKIISQMPATYYWCFICQQYCSCVDSNLHKWLREEDDYKLFLAKGCMTKAITD
jgi:hypothetical protein